jgi:hypothetical protein
MEIFSYNAENWKSHSRIILAAFNTADHKIRLITYSPCDCQEKYAFRRNSPLLLYLKECKGWVPDSSGYTLNYVMIVLLAYLKEQKLISFSKQMAMHMVNFSSKLKRALADQNQPKFYKISDIRLRIAKYHLKKYRKFFYTEIPYFICPNGLEQLIITILGVEGSGEQYFGYHY